MTKSFKLSVRLLLNGLAVLIVFLNGAQTVRAAEPAIPLKILSYNVHLLPDIAARVAGNRSDSDYRAKAIGKELIAYDIVGLSETFDESRVTKLLYAMEGAVPKKFVFAKGPRRSGTHFTSGGLLLVSRFPVEETHTITYADASWFLDSGFKADGFAAKGALHARIRVSDKPKAVVDVFLTHLESRSREAREKQIVEFAAFVTKYANDANPVIAMGDFNVGADTGGRDANISAIAHHEFLRAKLTHNDHRLIDTWETNGRGSPGTNDPLGADAGRRIDYIFFSDGASAVNKLRPADVVTVPFLDKRVKEGSLSDHFGVSCRAELVVEEK